MKKLSKLFWNYLGTNWVYHMKWFMKKKFFVGTSNDLARVYDSCDVESYLRETNKDSNVDGYGKEVWEDPDNQELSEDRIDNVGKVDKNWFRF